MVNYLGATYFHRFYLSSQTRLALDSRTLAVLHSLTNHVEVTLYYDRHADFYPNVVALLNEYRAANRNISVDTVDYNRDAGKAEIIKGKYQKYFTSQADKDLVIFDCAGRVKVFPGDALADYKTELKGTHPSAADPQKPELEFQRRLVRRAPGIGCDPVGKLHCSGPGLRNRRLRAPPPSRCPRPHSR